MLPRRWYGYEVPKQPDQALSTACIQFIPTTTNQLDNLKTTIDCCRVYHLYAFYLSDKVHLHRFQQQAQNKMGQIVTVDQLALSKPVGDEGNKIRLRGHRSVLAANTV